MNWLIAFSQNDQSKVDSLTRVVQQIENRTRQQIQIIDSLKLELTRFEINQLNADSLKAVHQVQAEMEHQFCEEMNIELIELIELMQSAENGTIKSGYYFRILPQENDQDTFNHEIEWLHVSESHEVKSFITANYEYCMYEMHFKRKPKAIYRQLHRNQAQFDSLYLVCNEGQKTTPSESINDEYIVLSRQDNCNCIHELLTFQCDGITRIIRTNNGIVSYSYKFVGK